MAFCLRVAAVESDLSCLSVAAHLYPYATYRTMSFGELSLLLVDTNLLLYNRSILSHALAIRGVQCLGLLLQATIMSHYDLKEEPRKTVPSFHLLDVGSVLGQSYLQRHPASILSSDVWDFYHALQGIIEIDLDHCVLTNFKICRALGSTPSAKGVGWIFGIFGLHRTAKSRSLEKAILRISIW